MTRDEARKLAKAQLGALFHPAVGAATEDIADALYDALTAPAPVVDPHGWTCFHCGETFTTPGAARDHFGFDPSNDTACRIKAGEERGLVMALRRAEAENVRLLHCLHEENTEALKALRRIESQIGEHARDAEQAGYDKVLRDIEAGKVERDHAERILAALRLLPAGV